MIFHLTVQEGDSCEFSDLWIAVWRVDIGLSCCSSRFNCQTTEPVQYKIFNFIPTKYYCKRIHYSYMIDII